ncbi:hypothetical protein [Phormidium sp. FACHB-1136]|nr:hypothetical protein [Phormidium sp. FACHB-1136]
MLPSSSSQNRRQVISELRHQLRYASIEERSRIRQELNFWMQHR